MSRFFAGGSDDESSGNESDNEPKVQAFQEQTLQRESAMMFESSDEEEDSQRVVLSAKDRRLENMKELCKTITNSIKVNDCVGLRTGLLSFSTRLISSRIRESRQAV